MSTFLHVKVAIIAIERFKKYEISLERNPAVPEMLFKVKDRQKVSGKERQREKEKNRERFTNFTPTVKLGNTYCV